MLFDGPDGADSLGGWFRTGFPRSVLVHYLSIGHGVSRMFWIVFLRPVHRSKLFGSVQKTRRPETCDLERQGHFAFGCIGCDGLAARLTSNLSLGIDPVSQDGPAKLRLWTL